MASENEARPRWFRKIFFGLNFTSVLTIALLAIAALTGAYLWGVITGRDMSAPAPAPASQKSVPDVSEKPRESILQAHELEFTQALRDEKRRLAPEEKPAEERKPASDEKPAAEGAAQVDNHAPEQSGAEDAGIYDFIFQMAALRDERSADNLRQALEGAGFRTRLEQSGKLLIVLALARGPASRAAEIARAARELRLGEPLLRSKKPVPEPSHGQGVIIQKSKDNR